MTTYQSSTVKMANLGYVSIYYSDYSDVSTGNHGFHIHLNTACICHGSLHFLDVLHLLVLLYTYFCCFILKVLHGFVVF